MAGFGGEPVVVAVVSTACACVIALGGLFLKAVTLFLRELRVMGQSRDEERERFLAVLEQHNRAMIRIVALVQSMADNCQHAIQDRDKIRNTDVEAALAAQEGR